MEEVEASLLQRWKDAAGLVWRRRKAARASAATLRTPCGHRELVSGWASPCWRSVGVSASRECVCAEWRESARTCCVPPFHIWLWRLNCEFCAPNCPITLQMTRLENWLEKGCLLTLPMGSF